MAQQTEFIPHEQALELKELGFEATPIGGTHQGSVFYYEDGKLYYDGMPMYSSSSHNGQILAPLYQQAFRWFREKKLSDSYVYRYQDRTDGSINYGYSIINDYGIKETRFIKENYIAYEEAELACLNRLIEIVKNK